MAQGIRPSNIILSAAIFIVLEIAALAMLRSSSVLQDVWLNRLSHRTLAILWSGGEKIHNFFQLEKQNQFLLEENVRLNAEVMRYKNVLEARDDAPTLMKMMNEAQQFRYIPATIVKMSRNSANNYIILNKGSEDGVRPNSAIVTPKGVVGVVEAVDRHYSYGLTLMNSKISLGTRVGKDGVIAPLVWDGVTTNGAYIKDVAPHFDIQPGDTVKTSGFSSIYPADIPLGVTRGNRLIDGFTREIEVDLFLDFSTLHYVTIVENLEMDEIDELEKGRK